MKTFDELAGGPLTAATLDVIQVNVGLKCNLACTHCHLEAGPNRTEVMDQPTLAKILSIAKAVRPGLVDITGGSPELNPHLAWFLGELAEAGLPTQVRSNLCVLFEPEAEAYFDLYAHLGVSLVSSLPCYLEENVSLMRGPGVFPKVIAAMRRLNAAGYGKPDGLRLDLVFNHPLGPYLPPGQKCLEDAYRQELGDKHGVVFSNLIAITNMPLGRYLDELRAKGQDRAYWNLLTDTFNPATLPALMCRRQISIGWDGSLYDCDFNLALGLHMHGGAPDHIDTFNLAALQGRPVATGPHCLGCTAGAGSSCGGALA